MGMFDFLKKGNKDEGSTDVKLFSPANGTVISIEEVADPVFSQKMMGDGYAVIPTDGKICTSNPSGLNNNPTSSLPAFLPFPPSIPSSLISKLHEKSYFTLNFNY